MKKRSNYYLIFMKKPYLGITGVANRTELSRCLFAFDKYGLFRDECSHIPMIGLLISHKIFEESYPHKRIFVTVGDTFELLELIGKKRVFKTIHYNSPNEKFSSEVIDILERKQNGTVLGEMVDGVQINILNPDNTQIKRIKERFPLLDLILQVNTKMIKNKDDIKALKRYSNREIDRILIDPSRGKGKSIDLYSLSEVSKYKIIKKTFTAQTIGFAGGFTGENISPRFDRISEMLGTHLVSIDTQSGIQGVDEMDQKEMESYVSGFMKALRVKENKG